MTTLASDPNRTETPNAPELPELVVPGVVEPGTCWTLRQEHDYYTDDVDHFPTWEQANQAVKITLYPKSPYAPDEPNEVNRRETYDLIDRIECRAKDCLRARRLAEIAYRDHQHRLHLEQARQRGEVVEERRAAAAAYRQRRLQLQQHEADCAEQLLELQRDEAARSEERLQLQRDEADRQNQLDLDQAVAQRDAELDRAATARAWRMVDHATHQIGMADAKAGLVITLQLGLIAAVGSSVLGAAHGPAGAMRWAAAAVLLIGVLNAAWAVLPRLPGTSRRTGEHQDLGLNFGVVRGLDAVELASLLTDVDEFAAASAEAANLSTITHAKYVRIRWAMLAGVVGLVLAVIATAVGAGVA